MARKPRKRGVPKWGVDGFMGHNQGDIGDVYAPYSPTYLSNAREAIDTFIKEIGAPLSIIEHFDLLEHISSRLLTGSPGVVTAGRDLHERHIRRTR